MKKNIDLSNFDYTTYRNENIKKSPTYEKRRAKVDGFLADLERGKEFTLFDEVEIVNTVHVTPDLGGKLSGVSGISTSCLMNPICIFRMQNPDNICNDCYAPDTFSGNMLCLETNTDILTRFNISLEAWACLKIEAPLDLVRIESHGDCMNQIQADNYLKIIISHPKKDFGIWTKNPVFYVNSFEKYGKPTNCTFVVSSPKKNEILELDERTAKYADHVFTVYTAEYVKEHDIKINCGEYVNIFQIEHRCEACGFKCYKSGTVYNIAELIKSEAVDIKTKKGKMIARKMGYQF